MTRPTNSEPAEVETVRIHPPEDSLAPARAAVQGRLVRTWRIVVGTVGARDPFTVDVAVADALLAV